MTSAWLETEARLVFAVLFWLVHPVASTATQITKPSNKKIRFAFMQLFLKHK